MYSLKDFEKAKVLVIIFSCNHCPTAQAYEDRIISLANDYKSKGVDIVMISPNSVKALNYSELGYSDMGDSFEEMKQRAADRKFQLSLIYMMAMIRKLHWLMGRLPHLIVLFLTKTGFCGMSGGSMVRKNPVQERVKI